MMGVVDGQSTLRNTVSGRSQSTKVRVKVAVNTKPLQDTVVWSAGSVQGGRKKIMCTIIHMSQCKVVALLLSVGEGWVAISKHP